MVARRFENYGSMLRDDRAMPSGRKVTEAPDVIAAGNIGCAIQIDRRASIPVVRTVELIDWAIGGPISLAPTHPSIIKEDA